jgi:ankyrin repeat protein
MIDITENPQAVDRITRIDSLFQLSLQTFDGFGSTDDSMASAASSMRKAALAGQPTARVMLGQFYEASGVEVDAAMRSECETLLVEAVERGSLFARIWLRRSNPEALKEAERKQAQKVAGVSLGQEKDSQFHPKDMVDGLFGETAFASFAPRLSAFPGIQTLWLSERRNSLLHTGAAFGVNPDRFRLFLGVLRGTINARDSAGNTALLIAIRFNNVDIAKILLEGGADASLANKRGETPFHWLVAIEKLKCTVDLVELLKRNGKNAFNATAEPPCTEDIFGINHGGTALHWAVELGMTDLARTLVSCRADIQNTFKGVRPVDIAVRRNKPEILRMFLDELRQRSETLALPVLPFTLGPNEKKASVGAMFDNHAFQAIASYPFHERLAYGGKGWVNALRDTLMVLREFGLAPKLPIWALSQLLSSTGNSATMLEILSEEDVLEGGSDQEKFWADITEKIILSIDTTNVLYAMNRARASSADGRIPNAEKILDICTESFGCDGAVVDAIANDGVKMDFPTKQFRTPLMGAILHRNFEIASALIRNGADVNAMWKPINPNSPDEVHPDVNILFEHVTVNQDTALAPLRYLLEPLHSRKDAVPSFVVVPSKKKTALHLACRYGNPLIMDYLLKKFDTPYHLDFIDEGGFTALHFAVFNGHAEAARKLCAKGARADILAGSEDLDPEHRRNALDYCHRLFAPDIDSLKNSHGVGRDLQDVYLGRLEIAKMLVRECQAVRTSGSKDDDDMVWSVKLCHYAVQNDMSRLLRGALENLRNDPASETPWQDAINLLLIEAALRGHTGSTKILIDYGADVNQVLRGDEQMTLLHQVVANRDDKMVYQLLRAGAKVNAYDKAGQTPLTYGWQCQDLRTCRVLKHFGGALTLDRESMARILAKSVSGDIEGSMAFLRDQNLHFNAKLAGEPSDDDTAGESEANEEDGEEEASDDDVAEEGAAAEK